MSAFRVSIFGWHIGIGTATGFNPTTGRRQNVIGIRIGRWYITVTSNG